MKNTTQTLSHTFRVIGLIFERNYCSGFKLRKPKKIIEHTKKVLRKYRHETSYDLFTKLVGTILIWRYAQMSKMPVRELLRIERSILRSFHFILKDSSVEDREMLEYLRDQETGPRRSVMGPGNPLRHILDLKMLEFQISDEQLPIGDKDNFEIQWKELYQELYKRFRFRILNPVH